MNTFQVLRARQVEQQIRATLLEQESFEASITSRWGDKGAVIIIIIIIIITKIIVIIEWHWSLVFTSQPSIAEILINSKLFSKICFSLFLQV